jgi:hypothetical protein
MRSTGKGTNLGGERSKHAPYLDGLVSQPQVGILGKQIEISSQAQVILKLTRGARCHVKKAREVARRGTPATFRYVSRH